MDPNEIFYLVRSSQTISYMFVSAGTLMVYDTLLVLPREVTHIWSAKWSAPKVLYLLTRYWGLVILFVDLSVYTHLQTSVQWCQRFLWYNMTIGSTSTLSLLVNIVLMMRLYALYGRSIQIVLFLVVIFLADIVLAVLSVVFTGPSAYSTTFVAPPSLPLLGCLSAPDISNTIYGWIGGLATAIILFVMMAYKLLSNNRTRPRRTAHTSLPPLIVAFYRDGTMAFFLIMCVTVVGFILSFTIDGPLQISYMPWVTVITSACGSRLILHLREAVYDDPTRHTEALSAQGVNAYKMQSVRLSQSKRVRSEATSHKPFISQDGIAVTVVKETHKDVEAGAF
ncbi:hypothetical protein BJ165DRAFT_1474381 [Panaeolus papilionaceus]|nr:hypothetical protein BJ165DRAFT_1474381 [Panaeolus papilionaceus]